MKLKLKLASSVQQRGPIYFLLTAGSEATQQKRRPLLDLLSDAADYLTQAVDGDRCFNEIKPSSEETRMHSLDFETLHLSNGMEPKEYNIRFNAVKTQS